MDVVGLAELTPPVSDTAVNLPSRAHTFERGAPLALRSVVQGNFVCQTEFEDLGRRALPSCHRVHQAHAIPDSWKKADGVRHAKVQPSKVRFVSNFSTHRVGDCIADLKATEMVASRRTLRRTIFRGDASEIDRTSQTCTGCAIDTVAVVAGDLHFGIRVIPRDVLLRNKIVERLFENKAAPVMCAEHDARK